MMITPQQARTALAVVRLTNGTIALLAPTVLLRRLGFDGTAGRAASTRFACSVPGRSCSVPTSCC